MKKGNGLKKIPLGIHNRVRLVMHRFMVNYEHL